MPTAAIYARYSTDEQRETSIEDQVRRCRETAAREGFTVDNAFVFSDSAVSGTAKGRAKRVGYQRLLDAIQSGLVDVVIVDDVSRVARNMLEGATLMELAEQSGLRIITCDGIDSKQRDWTLLWSFKLITAVQEVKGTADKVVRGMVGQLERGYQIAQPAFGYRGVREGSPSGRDGGTRWEVQPEEAAVVRRMYQMRYDGLSVAAIARRLNEDGVLPPNHRRCKGIAYWRPATVHRLLSNTVYRGTFIWNGSSFTRAKARARKMPVKTISYERPALRLVSDEVWAACNPSFGSDRKHVRGGGRHALAGLMQCGKCRAKLTIHGGPKSFAVHCPQCEQASRVGGHDSFIGYTSLAAAKQALNWGLTQLFTGEVLAEFRARLHLKLTEGPAKEQAILEARLLELEGKFERLRRLLLDERFKEDWVSDQFVAIAEERDVKKRQLDALKKRGAHVTAKAIAAQASIDPLPLIKKLLDGEPEPYKVRATLSRLLRKFEFVARPGKSRAVFELEFAPGLYVAELSGTEVVEEVPVRFRIEVSTTSARPVVWNVEGERQ